MIYPYQIVCEAISLNEMKITDPTTIAYLKRWPKHLARYKELARRKGQALVLGNELIR